MSHEFANRLIYAADINFADCQDIRQVHVKAAIFFEETREVFKGLGITIKGNTIFRLLGAMSLITLNNNDYGIFADYKFFDVRGTVNNDLSWLSFLPNIKILTIAEDVHPEVFATAVSKLPNTIIAPVNPLTDLEDKHFARRGEGSRKEAVRAFFSRVAELPSNGVICSPTDLKLAPKGFAEGREIITPAIRPDWAVIASDKNAANALTPRQAILGGATRLVVGRPIRHNGTMRENAIRILDEIGEAWRERNGI